MELTWQNVFMQAIPFLGGALAALLGALPGYFKDKRELAAKERLAADERTFARENERLSKAYDERKNSYVEFLKALQLATSDIISNSWENMEIASEKYGSLRLFCSDIVMAKADLSIGALRSYLLKTKKTQTHHTAEYATYINAYNELVSAMRLDLGVHQTELC